LSSGPRDQNTENVMTSMFDYDDSINLAFDAKTAGKALVAAKYEVLERTGDFLFMAHSDREFAYRCQVVEQDFDSVAARKMASVSDSKAKLVRALYEEWSLRHAHCTTCKEPDTNFKSPAGVTGSKLAGPKESIGIPHSDMFKELMEEVPHGAPLGRPSGGWDPNNIDPENPEELYPGLRNPETSAGGLPVDREGNPIEHDVRTEEKGPDIDLGGEEPEPEYEHGSAGDRVDCPTCGGISRFSRMVRGEVKDGKLQLVRLHEPDKSDSPGLLIRDCDTCRNTGQISSEVESCKSCGGRGEQEDGSTCPKCKGSKVDQNSLQRARESEERNFQESEESGGPAVAPSNKDRFRKIKIEDMSPDEDESRAPLQFEAQEPNLHYPEIVEEEEEKPREHEEESGEHEEEKPREPEEVMPFPEFLKSQNHEDCPVCNGTNRRPGADKIESSGGYQQQLRRLMEDNTPPTVINDFISSNLGCTGARR